MPRASTQRSTATAYFHPYGSSQAARRLDATQVPDEVPVKRTPAVFNFFPHLSPADALLVNQACRIRVNIAGSKEGRRAKAATEFEKQCRERGIIVLGSAHDFYRMGPDTIGLFVSRYPRPDIPLPPNTLNVSFQRAIQTIQESEWQGASFKLAGGAVPPCGFPLKGDWFDWATSMWPELKGLSEWVGKKWEIPIAANQFSAHGAWQAVAAFDQTPSSPIPVPDDVSMASASTHTSPVPSPDPTPKASPYTSRASSPDPDIEDVKPNIDTDIDDKDNTSFTPSPKVLGKRRDLAPYRAPTPPSMAMAKRARCTKNKAVKKRRTRVQAKRIRKLAVKAFCRRHGIKMA